MNRRLYVGNLPYSATEQDVAATFAEAGTVVQARIITDRETNKPRGFGFVEMASEADAQRAIEKFHGATYGGRTLTVNIAKEREQPAGGNGYGRQAGGRDRRDDRRRESRW